MVLYQPPLPLVLVLDQLNTKDMPKANNGAKPKAKVNFTDPGQKATLTKEEKAAKATTSFLLVETYNKATGKKAMVTGMTGKGQGWPCQDHRGHSY